MSNSSSPARRLPYLGKTTLLVVAVLVAVQSARGQRTDPRPNLIVILADDLGYGDVGCYGNRRIKTPAIDALAAGGVRFTDFHSSGAVCSPTRAGLMTGRYQQRAGVPGVITAAGHRDQGLSPDEITFAELLQAAGYATGVFGKWHLGYLPKFNPDKHGFDRFRGYVSGNVDYFSHVDQTGVADWWDNSKQITEEGYSTYLITKHSLKFIEDHRDRPFCLYVAHEAPHYPYQGPNDKPVRTVGGGKSRLAPAGVDVAVAYKEMVEAMDEGIGQIVASLRRLGLDRDTFIFFFSDNGACPRGDNGPLRGFKGSVWEGGHRVPAVAYWPGKIKPGQVRHETTISLDLFPTLLELGSVPGRLPAAHKLDGMSLVPLLLEGKDLAERTLFWGHGSERAVRQGPWKLVLGPKRRGKKSGPPLEPQRKPLPMLFNLAEDLGEQNNLAAKEPERVKPMLQALAGWGNDVQ